MKLGKTQRTVLDFLANDPRQWLTLDLAKVLSLTEDRCLSTLKRLYSRGLVLRVQNGKQFRWTAAPLEMIANSTCVRE